MEIGKAERKTQAWIPVPAVNEPEWFRSLGSQWTTNGSASLAHDALSGAEMLHVEWPDGERNPVLEVTSRIATRDRATDFAKPGCRPHSPRPNVNPISAAPNSFLSTASSRKRPIR